MSKQTESSLFMFSPLAKYAGLYQQLLMGIASYEELGNRILRKIETAQAFRQVEQVRELGTVLRNSPIKEYQIIGQYYLVWCDGRESKYHTTTLEKIIEQTVTYKTKAMLSLGAFEIYQGRAETSLYHYTEALKTSPSISEYIVLSRSIAALKSVEGFHRTALGDLEKLLPVIKHAEPVDYYDFLNSYAVELGAAGRKAEAFNITKRVLASPFAFAYPEWRETAEELKPANRSFVVIDPSPRIRRNLLALPAVERDNAELPAWAGQPAQVLSYERWKQRMAKKKDNGKKDIDKMSGKDMVIEIMHLLTSEDMTFEQRRKIYDYAVKVFSEPDKPDTPDDDTSGA